LSELKISFTFVSELVIMFSKACEYGIRASIYVAGQSHNQNRVSLKDIAKEIGSPEAFTAKILQQLSRNSIVDSVKGPNGGFQIEQKRIHKIKLSHIVLAIDGDSIYKGCGLGLKECSEKVPCPVHNQFKVIRNNIIAMLENTSLLDLTLGIKDGSTFLKM
jgi:Rrf2 family iron-sulfur cluster assembly transcriptional regulator